MTVNPQDPGVIKGYRQHNQSEIDLVNEIKDVEAAVAQVWLKASTTGLGVDRRMHALARTNIEQGFMWLVRSIFQPETDFDGSSDG